MILEGEGNAAMVMSYLFRMCAALAYQDVRSVVRAFGLARVFSLIEALT